MDSEKINFVKVNNFNQARQWIIQQNKSGIILPFQPLVIENQPNVLPMQYFIPTDLNDAYDKFYLLHDQVQKKAPPGAFSKKALEQLSNEILTQQERVIEQFQSVHWLMDAINEYLTHETFKNIKAKEDEQIKAMATWINQQYDQVIFFGWDDTYLSIIERLVQQLKHPIKWLMPAEISASVYTCLNELTENEKQPFSPVSFKDTIINEFPTAIDEVKMVLNTLKKREGQTVLVIPNDHLRSLVQAEALIQSIDIADDPGITLDQTSLGKFILVAINYIKNPTFTRFKAMIFTYPFKGSNELKQSIRQLEAAFGFKIKPEAALSHLLTKQSEVSPLHDLASIKNMNDILKQLQSKKVSFDTTNKKFRIFSIFNQCEALIQNALNHPHPERYLTFMIRKSNLKFNPQKSGLICITPETMGRYFDYPMWLMGLGDYSWSKKTTQTFIAIDGQNSSEKSVQLRMGFAVWGLSSPKFLGASMSEYFNNQEDQLLEGIQLSRNKIIKKIHQKQSYSRDVPQLHPISINSKLSPSRLQLYQRCPYAFYLKNQLKLTSNAESSSDLQQVGIIIHQLIEQMVQKKTSQTQQIVEWTQKHLNPLMQKIIQTKINNEWPLDDFITFCHEGNGDIKTEEVLQISVDDQVIEGRADIVVMNQNQINVIDVKTGKPPSKADVKNYEDIQLGLYLWMLLDKKQVSAHYYTKNNQLKTMFNDDDPTFQPLLDGLKERIKTLIQNIKSNLFLPEKAVASRTSHANQCRICDYYVVCHSKLRHQR
ncbi:MAG: PD-(D/E)XK nuclease family protein [Candidatus Margulisiibacteriota bacterium]